jgi:hypothetical protein
MKKILDVRHFIILTLIVIILFLKTDNNVSIKEIVKETPEKLIHDTILIPEYIQGEYIYHDTTIYVPTLVEVDSTEILKSFYTKSFKLDTIKLNNNQGFIYLSDSISQNQIISRKWSATLKPKIVRESSTPTPPIKNQVFFGVNGSWSQKDWVNSMGIGVILKTKKDHIYNVGIGVANRTTDGTSGELTPYLNGGVYWKIKLKKD